MIFRHPKRTLVYLVFHVSKNLDQKRRKKSIER
uniref:Uncharacterized protein n=1 Tax=Elaeophora elaphi TaxID=1147741 RepID=A0A0R3S5H7_9BILA